MNWDEVAAHALTLPGASVRARALPNPRVVQPSPAKVA